MKKLLVVLLLMLFIMSVPVLAADKISKTESSSTIPTLDDFEGTWVSKKVKVGNYFLPVQFLGVDMEVEIVGNVVYMTSDALNANHDSQLYTFDNGVLDYGDKDLSSEIRRNDDGMLEFSLFDDEMTMVFLLEKKEPDENNLILCKKDGVTIYLTGKAKISNTSVDVDVIIENNTDNGIYLYVPEASIDEWQVDVSLQKSSVASHKKRKTILSADISDAGITDINSINELDVVFSVCNSETLKQMFRMDGSMSVSEPNQ